MKRQNPMDRLFAGSSISVRDLKKNSSAVIAAAARFPVAIRIRNSPSAYIVPADVWQDVMDRLDDIELAALLRDRSGEMPVEIGLDQL